MNILFLRLYHQRLLGLQLSIQWDYEHDHHIVHNKLKNLCVTIIDDLHPVVKQIYDCYTKILELKVYDKMIKL